jgi:hypothetical protein
MLYFKQTIFGPQESKTCLIIKEIHDFFVLNCLLENCRCTVLLQLQIKKHVWCYNTTLVCNMLVTAYLNRHKQRHHNHYFIHDHAVTEFSIRL